MHKGTHHNNKKKTEFIEVNGKLLNKTSLYYWTSLAKECYERHCVCTGCTLIPKMETPNFVCRIKDFVMGYFLLGKYPNEEVDK